MNTELTQKEKEFVAFAIFSFSMKVGPACFEGVEIIIGKLGIENEFVDRSKHWSEYCAQKKKTS